MNAEVKTEALQFIVHRSSFIISLLLLFSITSCNSRNSSQDNQTDSSEINVAAAANLTDAFTEMGKEFTARTGIRVTFSFGASADLERQIENGAPFDVFASADVENVEKLNSRRL